MMEKWKVRCLKFALNVSFLKKAGILSKILKLIDGMSRPDLLQVIVNGIF